MSLLLHRERRERERERKRLCYCVLERLAHGVDSGQAKLLWSRWPAPGCGGRQKPLPWAHLPVPTLTNDLVHLGAAGWVGYIAGDRLGAGWHAHYAAQRVET